MMLESESCYRALSARAPCFDGVFFVGVATTGIDRRLERAPGRAIVDATHRLARNALTPLQEGALNEEPCRRLRPRS